MNTLAVIKNWSIATTVTTLLVLGTSKSAAAATFYSITDLGSLGGITESYAPAINDLGQVVGSSVTSSGITQGFLWENGVFKSLTSPGIYSNAVDINNLGQVIGRFDESGWWDWHNFLWEKGTITDLGIGYPQSINDAGQIVGSFSYGQALWQNGTLTKLTPNFSPYAINNAGQVVGQGTFFDSNLSSTSFYAALWENGTLTKLGEPMSSVALDINDLGQVVGRDHYYFGHAVLWENGMMTDLGTLAGYDPNTFSVAHSINNKGQIVGSSNISSIFNERAVLWENGTITDLNNLLADNSGWMLSQATDINNGGQIVGMGVFNGQSHAFLLTPVSNSVPSVPEPDSALGLLAFSVFGLGIMLKRQLSSGSTLSS